MFYVIQEMSYINNNKECGPSRQVLRCLADLTSVIARRPCVQVDIT